MEFECPVCLTDIDPRDGIRLSGCLHMICKSVQVYSDIILFNLYRDCLRGTVVHSQESEVKCPYTDGNIDCQEPISEREIRAVSERYNYLFIVDC